METNEMRRYEMLVRVKKFGETYIQLFPASSLGGKTFAAVAAAVAALSDQAVSKMSTDRGGLTTRNAARDALRDQLGAVARTARQVANMTEGLDDKFQLPHQPNDHDLVTAGRLFARDAAAFQDAFIAHALPPTFVADLSHAVDTFAQAIDLRDGERERNTEAKASIEAALAKGFAAVCRLDVIIANTLKDDPVTMQVWKADRRVRYANRTPKAEAKTAQDAPASGTRSCGYGCSDSGDSDGSRAVGAM